MAVAFHSESIDFELPHVNLYRQWLRSVAKEEGQLLGELNYIFCDDAYLHTMNVAHLQHDTYTDVITFQYHEEGEEFVEGDIFISVERTNENAEKYQVPALTELARVMVHGLLHLLGYKDKTDEQQAEMSKKEDVYLATLPNFLVEIN